MSKALLFFLAAAAAGSAAFSFVQWNARSAADAAAAERESRIAALVVCQPWNDGIWKKCSVLSAQCSEQTHSFFFTEN